MPRQIARTQKNFRHSCDCSKKDSLQPSQPGQAIAPTFSECRRGSVATTESLGQLLGTARPQHDNEVTAPNFPDDKAGAHKKTRSHSNIGGCDQTLQGQPSCAALLPCGRKRLLKHTNVRSTRRDIAMGLAEFSMRRLLPLISHLKAPTPL
jgi:hypothetical protein